jgi:hypothetical protein
MTEKDLKELNFDKIVVTTEESDNEKEYYYYELIITEGLHLVSTDSDESKNDKWIVKNWDWPAAIFSTKESINSLMFLSNKYNNK